MRSGHFRSFLFHLLPVFIIASACNSSWMQQKYHYLNKVAAGVSAERDSVMKHAQQIFPEVEKAAATVIASDKSPVIEQQKSGTIQNPVQFARSESERIIRSHPELRPLMKRHSSMAEVQNPGALLIVLLIVLLIIFLFLAIAAAGNSDGTCLGCFFWLLVIGIFCILIGLLI